MTNSEEGKTFGKISELYDRARVGYPDQLIADIIVYSGTEIGKVLDVGCGSGQATIPLVKRGYDVIALDISKEMIDILKSKCSYFKNVSFKVGSFESVKLDPDSLDIIVSGMAWHWIDPENRLKKAYKLLKNKGTLAVFWSYQLREKSDFIRSIGKILDKYGEVNREPTGSRIPSIADQVCQELKESGTFYDVKTMEYFQNFEFSKQKYIDIITSYGWVQVLSEEKRMNLVSELKELLKCFEEPLIIPYRYVLALARKS